MTDKQWRPGDPVDWERPGNLFTGGGLHALVLETAGAKSGELRRAVLGYLEVKSDGWLVVGSLGGADRNPAWVHNLAKHPEATVVLADGKRVHLHGVAQLHSEGGCDTPWMRPCESVTHREPGP